MTSISKVLGKLLNFRLVNYFNKFKVIVGLQYGFRSGFSTEDAITALTSIIIVQLDNGKMSLEVFLDIKKAFDTVSVPILEHRLENIRIQGLPMKLIKII